MEGLEAFYTTVAGSISCPQDAVVCLVHWAIIKNGYKCVGSGDEPGSADKGSELLPADWNNNKEVYTLRYTKKDKDGASHYLLKAQTVDAAIVIVNVINSDTLRDSVLTVNIGDHADADRLQSFDHVYKDVDGLAEKVRSQLLSPQVEPAAGKAEKSTTTEGQQNEEEGRRVEYYDYPYYTPIPQPQWPPNPHRFVPRTPRPIHPIQPEWPGVLGGGDLDPLNPLGGGMIMDPRNVMPPRFNPTGGIPSAILPPGSVPPGARFDPFGPAEPEPDHLPPPGHDYQYARPAGGRFDPSGRHGPRPGPPGPAFS